VLTAARALAIWFGARPARWRCWLRRQGVAYSPGSMHEQVAAQRAWAETLDDARCAAELRAAADRQEQWPEA